MGEVKYRKHIFIVGCKGIPAHYGGFETFVDNLVKKQKSDDIQYHVSCMDTGKKEKTEYYKAERFFVKTHDLHSARAVLYDINALKLAIEQIKENGYRDGIVYILACRIGPFIKRYVKKLHKYGFKVYVNPDGHEWMRAKWNKIIKKYWRLSEKLMIKHCDLAVCDSVSIENYICQEYEKYNPKTTYISYGADTSRSTLKDDAKELVEWYKKWDIKKKNYYLMVGRFVPENNYELVIREFVKSKSKKDLVIVTNHDWTKFLDHLKDTTGFENDKRVKFVGTVYDQDLIKKIRENSFAYIHGHSVGGTNPSLLEALASTDINLLYDCGFNREVAENGALYFLRDEGSLTQTFNLFETTKKDLSEVAKRGRKRIHDFYDWNGIINQYEELFNEK